MGLSLFPNTQSQITLVLQGNTALVWFNSGGKAFKSLQLSRRTWLLSLEPEFHSPTLRITAELQSIFFPLSKEASAAFPIKPTGKQETVSKGCCSITGVETWAPSHSTSWDTTAAPQTPPPHHPSPKQSFKYK